MMFRELFSNKKTRNIIIVVIMIIVFVGTSFLINQKQENPETSKLSKIDELSTQKQSKTSGPLAQGEQVYSVMGGGSKSPEIIEVRLNPLDVKVGNEQIITVKVQDADTDTITGDTGVVVTYLTDNGSSSINLKLRRVDDPPIEMTWQGIWVPEDTHDLLYGAIIKAVSTSGEEELELMFR